MTLRTVRVPENVETYFERAERLVTQLFREWREDASTGSIEIFGERYVLVRAAALSVQFFDLVRNFYGSSRSTEADDVTKHILFDLAYSIGRADAQTLNEKMGLSDPLSRLAAGPVHFAHTGWAFVDISPRSKAVPGDDFVLHYQHPYSFESDAWIRDGRTSSYPVCIMSAGYSSGWCTESFGQSLVATEITCRARGDEICRFVMAPPARLAEYVDHETSVMSNGNRAPTQVPDLFARQKLEDELRRRFAEELRERDAAEKRLRRAQKLEAVGRLAGGVAHDFNNLMTVVIARANRLARKMPADDPIRRELEGIVEAGERASALTGQLLAFSRAHVVHREAVEVDRVLSDIVRVFRVPEDKPVKVDIGLEAHGIVVMIDRSQLEQIALNLLVNAREAMPQGGGIRISTTIVHHEAHHQDLPRGECLRMRVEDDGMGMDEVVLGRIFEPYFTTKIGHGTGLGLATTYGIVQQAGGAIVVDSEVGRGTRFDVFFPVHSRGGAAAELSEVLANHESKRPLRLLLLEDHPDVRATLEIGLIEAGHEVVSCSDSSAAMTIDDATLASIDALVTDVSMPVHSGVEVARALRARRADLPVIFVTGYAADPSTLATVRGSRVLTKPFHTEDLVSALRSVLRTGPPPTAQA